MTAKPVTQSLTIALNVAAMILIGIAAAFQFGIDQEIVPTEYAAIVATAIALANNVVNILLRFKTVRPVELRLK